MTRGASLWWKVVVDSDGKVVSCDLAIEKGQDHNSTFFVYAPDVRRAGRLAFNLYMRVVQKARHERLKRAGMCRCGKPNDSGTGSRCLACKQRDSKYAKRQRARDRGEEVPELDRFAALAARREADRDDIRLEVYREVNRRALTMDKRDFIRWLQSKCEELAGKKVA